MRRCCRTKPRQQSEADNAQWDALLATDSAQNMLKQLIAEASAEYSAGKTRPISLTTNALHRDEIDDNVAVLEAMHRCRWRFNVAPIVPYKLWQLNPRAHSLFFKRVGNRTRLSIQFVSAEITAHWACLKAIQSCGSGLARMMITSVYSAKCSFSA